jgi:arylformamidase
MSQPDLNIEYNARLTVLNHAEISARWVEAAAQYRNEANAELDIPYGNTERLRYDYFPAINGGPLNASQGAPLCAFIHGGYWRSRSAKTFSHIARNLNEHGICVAIPTYDLVPHVSLMEIVEQMRGFLVHLWEKTGTFPVVAGHSAGGHLAGAMLATDWAQIDGAPDDLVSQAFALSGLYDLKPLLETDINEDLRLTPELARETSPIHWPSPRQGLKFVAAVGSQESDVFKDQSRRLSEVWGANGIETEYYEVPDCNHFTIVDAVTTPGHALAGRLHEMLEARTGS